MRLTWTLTFALTLWITGMISQAADYASHPPLRPLPPLSDRPLATGPAKYVDPVKGDDGAAGTEAAPWRTVNGALPRLEPGDTLYLRGGTYFENVYCAIVGTEDQPITIRSYPGERAILDGGIPAFQTDPAAAWEPAPEGAPGEYRSTATYRNIRDVVGAFGDSHIGLQTYWYRMDLQSTEERWITDPEQMVKPVYCGPGLYYDKASGHIYTRLAHTELQLPDTAPIQVDRYQGETDPRKLPLIVAPFNSTPLTVDQGMNLRFYDLVIRGGGYVTLNLVFGVNLEFDGCTILAGSYGIWAKNTGPLKMRNCGVHGIIPPWAWRTENVMYSYSGTTYPPFVGDPKVAQERAGEAESRTPATVRRHISRLPTHAIMATAGGYEFETFYTPHNHDWDIAYCEFTDSHDGPYISGRHIRFHHNWVDNMQDDSVYVSSPTPYFSDDVHIYQNVVSTGITGFGGHARGGPGGNLYIYRNVIDMRRPVQFGRPTPEKPQGNTPTGYGAWIVHNPDHIIHQENMYFYQNTTIYESKHVYTGYAGGMIYHADAHGAERRVFNNLYLMISEKGWPQPYGGMKRSGVNLVFDHNLHWNVTTKEAPPRDLIKVAQAHPMSTENLERYPDGWAAHSLFVDPKLVAVDPAIDAVNDYRLQPDSPAKGAGLVLPADWDDPLRPADGAAPDIGAIPVGAENLRVGIHGRVAAGMNREWQVEAQGK